MRLMTAARPIRAGTLRRPPQSRRIRGRPAVVSPAHVSPSASTDVCRTGIEEGSTLPPVVGYRGTEVHEGKPARVVFDSLSEFRLSAGTPPRYRRQAKSARSHLSFYMGQGRKCGQRGRTKRWVTRACCGPELARR